MRVIVPLAFLVVLATGVVSQDFRTPIGSPCNADPVDDGCVADGECLASLCQCKDGFSVTSSFNCKADFGGNCTTSNDCNTQMGLLCINSTCGCSNVANQEYLSELGTCVNATMKLMYEDIVAFINQTELELTKFSTLLQIFMIIGSPENETATTTPPPLDIQNNVDSLRQLDEQIQAPQEPIPATALPPTTSASPVVPETSSSAPEIPVLSAQPPETPTTTAVPRTTLPPPVVAPQETLAPVVVPTTPLPNSLNNLIFNIIPTQGNSGVVSLQDSGAVPLQDPGSTVNQQISNLANVLPQFLAMFKEFVPMLQSYNEILGSSLFTNSLGGNSGSSVNGIGNGISNVVSGAQGRGGDILGSLIRFNPFSAITNTIANTLGTKLGSTLGSGLGSTLGSTLGSGLGSTLGSGLGSTVGSGFGSTVGSGFGSTVGSGFGSTLGSTVGNLGSAVGNTFGNLGSTVGNTFGNRGGQGGAPVWNTFPSTPRPTLLQVPGRIFTSLFGRNSTINNLKRRIIPFNLGDNSNRIIPFLPFIG